MTLRMALRGAAVAWMCLFLGISAASAQPPSGEAGTKVSAGDVLQIVVEGRNDISGSYTVDKSGNIVLPVVGRVAVGGRTISEINTDVARRMSLVSSKITQVAVTLAQVASRRNFVLGAVLLPGMYVFRDQPTVWDAIAEAGGPTDDADLTKVEVFSELQPKPAVVDVTSGPAGNTSTLPRLRPGDTVRVPRLTASSAVAGEASLVYVFGAVGVQGPQPIGAMPDLVTAFIRCNPAANADMKNVEIVRRNGPQIVRMKVSMSEYFERGDIVGNPQLQAGDTIHFPREKAPFSPLRILGVTSVIGALTSILVFTR
jgi:protein involved in polysaccharide export with SLBB domain